jgi:hypothetical protein
MAGRLYLNSIGQALYGSYFSPPALWQFGNVAILSGLIEANWAATRRFAADDVTVVS